MVGRLEGKTALVTGASSGLGRRFALKLASEGARVAAAARRVERLEALCAEVAAGDGRVLPIALDVADPSAVAGAVERAETELGAIDILVNNAGVAETGRAVDVTPERYDAVMGVNVRGAFFVATEVGRRMIAGGRPGRVVNIASLAARHVLPGLATYCMSKAAVAMMTRALAAEWASDGINVNAICPGYVRTEINDAFFDTPRGRALVESFPRARLGAPEDLDGALMLFCGEEGRIVTGALLEVHDAQMV